MTSVAFAPTAVSDPITQALLDPRPHRRVVRARVRAIRRALYAERQDRFALLTCYRGGLRGEQDAAAALRLAGKAQTKARRAEVRAAYLSRVGRRIDLLALLSLSRPDGAPAWTVADPTSSPTWMTLGGHYNRHFPGTAYGREVAVHPHEGVKVVLPATAPYRKTIYRPTGMPPLPPEVRALATDRTIRRRAAWVGILYQPTAWEELRPNPDPALVVEWKDRPGEYYALAVWGGDRARIMEFVD